MPGDWESADRFWRMQFPPESWDGIKPEGKEEDRAIVQWLDRFPTGSVLYIRQV